MKSGDFCTLALACTPVQAADHRFELIPISLQRGCVEIVNTFCKHFGSSSALSRSEYRNSLTKARIVQLLGYLRSYPE